MPFKIGPTLGELEELGEIFSPEGDVFDPDWSYKPFATARRLLDGTVKGQGFPVAIWRFNHLSNENREVLKELCPGLSSEVFIETRTNETSSGVETWGIFSAVMEWTPEDEDKAAAETLGVLITFTHLIEQEEP